MNDTSAKAIFVEYFLSQQLLYDVRNFLPLPFRRVDGKRIATGIEPHPLIESINDKARELSLDQPRFDRLLATHTNALLAGRKPTKSLENFIVSHWEETKGAIRNIPNTPDKARDALLAMIEVEEFSYPDGVYDAMVFLKDDVPSEIIARVVRSWKEEARTHEERHKDSMLPASHIFWSSADFMETDDAISRYRFREHFGIGEFELAFAEVESMLATSLLEGSTGMEAITIPFWGDQKFTSVAYNLWLVGRSRNLPSRIRPFVDAALLRIVGWQFPGGWWTDFQLAEPTGKDARTGIKTSRYLPSTYTTALCSLNLLKLSISEPMREKGVLGAKWLLDRQNPDGSWSTERISEEGIGSKPDLFTTLLSLEAIARSRIEDIEHSIDLGAEWLMDQQNELGMWESRGFSFSLMTVLVLEFLKSKDSFSKTWDTYLSMSRGFLARSVQLSLQQNSNSHRLAIITAFHGIEAFLYSALNHLNIKIFETPGKTIGMRKALTQFQTYLQDKGQIGRNEVVAYRNSLDRLAYLRDEVIHKGIDITESMCRPLVDDALKFATKYSVEIFGHDIFV